MHRIAAHMRAQAEETAMPDYQDKMRRAAATLEAQAEILDERCFQEFSKELGDYSASLFPRSRRH